MDAGAGIRIQRQRWRAPVIRRAVRTVLTTGDTRRHAEALAGAMRTDDAGTAAEPMRDFLLTLGHPASPVPRLREVEDPNRMRRL